jgi:hypothetical protein
MHGCCPSPPAPAGQPTRRRQAQVGACYRERRPATAPPERPPHPKGELTGQLAACSVFRRFPLCFASLPPPPASGGLLPGCGCSPSRRRFLSLCDLPSSLGSFSPLFLPLAGPAGPARCRFVRHCAYHAEEAPPPPPPHTHPPAGCSFHSVRQTHLQWLAPPCRAASSASCCCWAACVAAPAVAAAFLAAFLAALAAALPAALPAGGWPPTPGPSPARAATQ